MRAVLIIASNTFREVIRDRILYGLIVFALLLLFLSLALGQLTFDESIRLTANFGFTGIHMASMALAIFIGSTLVGKEIDKQTILTVLARPITRGQFIVGKAGGLFGVLAVVIVALAIILSLFLYLLGFRFTSAYPYALLGILAEAAIILGLTLFFGSFARPSMTVVFSVAVFLIGHWTESLHYFIKRSSSEAFRAIATFIAFGLPDLERLNWRSAPIYDLSVPLDDVLASLGSTIGWVILLLSATILVFRRRDFV